MSDIERRFWAKVAFGDECWEWQATLDDKGYGCFWKNGRFRKAHRIAYELAIGPIPEEHQLHHICRNPRCVRPTHLQPTTAGRHPGAAPDAMRSKTHCARGHEYTPENTYNRRTGGRSCRQCKRENSLRWWREHKSKAQL